MESLTVTTYLINEGQKSEYYGLKEVRENRVLYGAPNNWKTRNGALRWARTHGFAVEQ